MSRIQCNVCEASEESDGAMLVCITCYNELRVQLAAVTERLRKTHKDYGFEIRDPCGTIWQECARLQKELAASQAQIEKMKCCGNCAEDRMLECASNERNPNDRCTTVNGSPSKWRTVRDE
jgi:hypothetical protein